MSQFSLLGRRRFGPFFATQFLGAFNDNLFKNAVVILFAFSGLTAAEADLLVNLSAGIFILPFFLFSAAAGQLADKLEKGRLIRLIKLWEIAIMTMAAVGFFVQSVTLLLVVLFLMGTQSTMFGPVKYSILPQHLPDDELTGGNGLVEMGTFVAILIGTIAGGLLIAVEPHGPLIVSAAVIGLALLGWLTSRRIPSAPAAAPGLRLRLNPITETVGLVRHARHDGVVYWAIIAISWFWFYGALFLAQFPGYARSFLGGDEQVVTAMLAAFTVGIGVGSTLCERLSGGRIELGLVPLGAIGLTAFAVDLYLASPVMPLPPDTPATVGALEFLSQPAGLRILADLTLIGVFGGWFIVPLYTLMQHRSRPSHRSRVIAANNVLNALFMVAAAGTAMVLRAAGVEVTELFLLTGLASAVVVVLLCVRVPEFPARFVVWLMSRTLARVRGRGIDREPASGPVAILCEDAGPLGVLAIAAFWRRPVRFVVPAAAVAAPGLLRLVLRASGAIVLDEVTPNALRPGGRQADAQLVGALGAADVLCMFRRRSPTGAPLSTVDADDRTLASLLRVLRAAQAATFRVSLQLAGDEPRRARTLLGAAWAVRFGRVYLEATRWEPGPGD